MELKESILELIRKAATDLSPDVEQVISDAYAREDEGTPAKNVFNTILENVRMAREKSTPICQDTGSLIFYIDFPQGESEKTSAPMLLILSRRKIPATTSGSTPLIFTFTSGIGMMSGFV
jgi:tartrate dehydratase alpha subunit/fumarate hydratase class I-like protein